ncbi:unnamed protein product, partial [Effrenium voratum]
MTIGKENKSLPMRTSEAVTPVKKASRHSRVGLDRNQKLAWEAYIESKPWSKTRPADVYEERGTDEGCAEAEGPPGIAGHALRHLMSALREKDVQSRMDADGFISIQWLLKAKPVLSSACNGDAKWMATAMGQEEQVRLDKSRRRVRLLSRSEHLLAEAMRIMQDKPFEVVPLRNFFSIPALKEYTNPESAPMIAFQSTRSFSQDWLGVLREALEHADSDLMVQGAFVASRPRAAKLRKSVEQLFENQDPRLQAKMQQTGELPLTWIVSRYADRLGIFAQEDARASEAIAKELAAALRDSEALLVDDRRLSVRKFPQSPERVPEREAQAVPANETQVMEKRAGSSRAATQLRQLLDFYFEPFTLQHNRYLLDLILKRAHAPQDTGPWLAEALHNCSFTFQ